MATEKREPVVFSENLKHVTGEIIHRHNPNNAREGVGILQQMKRHTLKCSLFSAYSNGLYICIAFGSCRHSELNEP